MKLNTRRLSVKIPSPVPYKRNGREHDVREYMKAFDKMNNLKPAEYKNDAYNYRT